MEGMREVHLARDGPGRWQAAGDASRRTKRCTGDVTGLVSLTPHSVIDPRSPALPDRETGGAGFFHGRKSSSGSVEARGNRDRLRKPSWRTHQTVGFLVLRAAQGKSSDLSLTRTRNARDLRSRRSLDQQRDTIGGGCAATWLWITLCIICLQCVHIAVRRPKRL